MTYLNWRDPFTWIIAVPGVLLLIEAIKLITVNVGSIVGLAPEGYSEIESVAKIFVFAVIAIGGWASRKDEAVWTKRIFYIASAIFFFLGIGYFAYGERFVTDPTSQIAFDPSTGEPTYMGFLDSGGVWQRGFGDQNIGEKGELLRPSQCRPLEMVSVLKPVDGAMKRVNELQPVAHDGFDYSTDGTCFSPSTGERMVPVSAENVPITPSLRPFSTPAERAALDELDRAAEEESWNNRQPTPAVLPTPRAADFSENCTGVHLTALNQGRIVECMTGTLFANGEDLILPARSDACFSTNKSGLVTVTGIDVLTINPETGEQAAGPDGVSEAYRVSRRHNSTVTNIVVWYPRDGATFQLYTCDKGTTI
jgi:hypothetical protein